MATGTSGRRFDLCNVVRRKWALKGHGFSRANEPATKPASAARVRFRQTHPQLPLDSEHLPLFIS
jgi:hypothetical protein